MGAMESEPAHDQRLTEAAPEVSVVDPNPLPELDSEPAKDTDSSVPGDAPDGVTTGDREDKNGDGDEIMRDDVSEDGFDSSSLQSLAMEAEPKGVTSASPAEHDGDSSDSVQVLGRGASQDHVDHVDTSLTLAATKPTSPPVLAPTPTSSFTPYVSPLQYFRSYRFHPEFKDAVKSGLKSLTYSGRIKPDVQLCPHELEGRECPDGPSCTFQHFASMVPRGMSSVPLHSKNTNLHKRSSSPSRSLTTLFSPLR